MVRAKVVATAMLALLGTFLTYANGSSDRRIVDVVLPRPAASNETIGLAVRVGFLPRGTEVEVTTPAGELIGTVSPFGIRDHQPAGTYTFPIRQSMIHDGHVAVSLSVKRAGTQTRAPTPDEVTDVSVVFIRVAQ
ncbi:MAG: hypothetical protein ACLP4V_33510 [Methylocella sp.]|jgi:hypothetical protein